MGYGAQHNKGKGKGKPSTMSKGKAAKDKKPVAKSKKNIGKK
tara:strand:- start:10798 stop:10923 length:126 start_codon:yes stop_codon:yes gene_type:complete